MQRILISLVTAIAAVIPAFGSTVDLNTASSFGLLGGTISNTGVSVVNGDVGATTTVTGFPPGRVTAGNTVYSFPSNPIVAAAYSDFEAAFGTAAGDASTYTPADLTTSQVFSGGGVYAFSTTNITSTPGITLTFDGNSSSVFIMQISGALQIDGPITFDLEPGVLASNIYWIVGNPTTNLEAATITPTDVPITWDGDILAGTFTMSANTGAGGSGVLGGTINGCVLTVNANTLQGETDVNGCSAGGAASVVPEPGSAGLVLSLGVLLGILAWARKGRQLLRG